MQSPFNPYMGRASRSPFYDILSSPLMSGMYGDTNNGLGPNAGQQNDSMIGGTEEETSDGFSGRDLFNEATSDFGVNTGPARGAPQAPSNVPGLPSAPETPATPADLGMNSPTADLGTNDSQINGLVDKSANLDSKSMGDVSPEGALGGMGSPAGVPGSEQNSPNAVGGMMDSRDTAATGMAPGAGSGENATSAGPGSVGGGDGGGGNGSGANGVGNPGDAGSGTPGAGQSGEGGQWRRGTVNTGDDGDRNRDEPVKGQVHENESVLTRHATKGVGKKFLAAANKEFSKKGADREAVLKKLAPLLGKD